MLRGIARGAADAGGDAGGDGDSIDPHPLSGQKVVGGGGGSGSGGASITARLILSVDRRETAEEATRTVCLAARLRQGGRLSSTAPKSSST